MREAFLLSCWSGVKREDIRKLLRSMPVEDAVEILEREVPHGKPSPEEYSEMEKRALSGGIGAVVYGTEAYPQILADIPDPPVVLYYIGDLAGFLSLPAVAVIGSRRCTAYGRRVSRGLARDFVHAGVAVVSGLARGIDSEAHAGALDAGGITAAVLGNGLDLYYPPEHEKLSGRIAESGVLLSEYPPGTQPARFRFPERNRLISGLSLGVVVVEAGKKSGTMITVNSALDQGREVFAVPGEVTRALSMGTNMLLRDGAGVVITAGDVLEPLGISLENRSPVEKGFQAETEAAGAIIKHLGEDALHFDILLRLSSLDRALLQSELLRLEMAGIVRQLPGKIYTLS